MRLINADPVEDRLKELAEDSRFESMKMTYEDCLQIVRAAKTVEVKKDGGIDRLLVETFNFGYEEGRKATQRHGHYIKGENGEWYCSNCKRIDDKYSVARFCWYCGAKMDGGEDREID